jgi:hypothetical protein
MSDLGAAWVESNQGQLVASLARVRQGLERYITQRTDGLAPSVPDTGSADDPAAEQPEPSSALSRLRETFHLSPFGAMSWCCAPAWTDAGFGSLCASAGYHCAIRPSA